LRSVDTKPTDRNTLDSPFAKEKKISQSPTNLKQAKTEKLQSRPSSREDNSTYSKNCSREQLNNAATTKGNEEWDSYVELAITLSMIVDDCAWVVNPLNKDIGERGVTKVLQAIDFPGKRMCWRCGIQRASGVTLISDWAYNSYEEGAFRIEKNASGYLCVPHCISCKAQSEEFEEAGYVWIGVIVLSIIAVVVLAILAVFSATIITTGLLIAGGGAAVVGCIGYYISVTRQNKQLEAQGLKPGRHPQVTKLRKHLKSLVAAPSDD